MNFPLKIILLSLSAVAVINGLGCARGSAHFTCDGFFVMLIVAALIGFGVLVAKKFTNKK